MKQALTFLFIFGFFSTAFSQVHVGLYQGGILSHIGAGTDPEKSFFAEARLLAGGEVNPFLGAEILGHYNLRKTTWYNLHAGLMLGYSELDNGKIGLPLGFSFKPIAAHRQFALLLEGTPFYENTFAIRALVGLRYTFRKEE
ncbi:hypothetical protein [Cyclobacterium xiamenense]|uniref:hypothetical protein n=1 Tax=Cyclobacterium xiamenense TaxID=1297121 RepID=UPI0012B7450A|nr:hypothetical protein [Cyclobacterium xiamenense]